MARTSILHLKRHRLLRKHVSLTENVISVLIFGALGGVVLWVMAQKDHYNPADRDVSIELLRQTSTRTELYNLPLKPWSEPGAAGASQAPDLGPFPTAILDQEWRLAAGLKQFGADNLYEKINGEAPKFLKQGFQGLYYIVLKSTSADGEIAIELYDQGDMGGSMGIFSEHLAAGKTIEQHGPVVFFRTPAGVIGRKGPFFFRVAGDSNAEYIRQKAQQLATAFAQLPEAQSGTSQENQAQELIILRDALGIAPELITFERQNVFQYDFAQDFWFGRLRGSQPAQDDPTRFFIHRAPSAEQARELFERLLEEHSYEYEIIAQSDDNILFRHEFLKNNFFALSVAGRFVFGVENAPDQDTINASLQQLSEALADG